MRFGKKGIGAVASITAAAALLTCLVPVALADNGGGGSGEGGGGVFLVKSVFRVGAGAVLLDSSLIPSPPIMPQDRARVDDP